MGLTNLFFYRNIKEQNREKPLRRAEWNHVKYAESVHNRSKTSEVLLLFQYFAFTA